MCKDAAEQLGYQFKGEVTEDNFPNGCYETGSDAYFNNHVGSKNPAATQICIHAGKGLRSFLCIYCYNTHKCSYANDSNRLNINSRSMYCTSMGS